MAVPILPVDASLAFPPDSAPCVFPELAPLDQIPSVRRVLVLEDDAIERDLLVHRLELLGLQITAVDTLRAARSAMASSGPYDLAIMDVHLPDGSGLDLCQEVVDSAKTADLPVIILSSVRDTSIVRRSRAAGGLFFLGKPYDPNVLLAIIENAIGL